VPLVVTIPAPGATSGGAPTGIVANTGSATDFVHARRQRHALTSSLPPRTGPSSRGPGRSAARRPPSSIRQAV
jgi:hypothetical protein